jgi:N-acetylmuramoyl-L-alanine amidase
MKICLDPGHGGNDSGAVGPNGLNESDVVLDIAMQVAAALQQLQLETKLTRTCDAFVELGQRCHIANDWVADYFVSIHCNSNGPSAVGIETLYATEDGEALAIPIQEMLLDATGDTDRGLKYRSDLYVLNVTQMPAVLAEVGFISHPPTEQLFKTEPYRRLVADAIAAGIAKFLNLAPPPPPPLA